MHRALLASCKETSKRVFPVCSEFFSAMIQPTKNSFIYFRPPMDSRKVWQLGAKRIFGEVA
jgi:site-specific DNA-adenine methylase